MIFNDFERDLIDWFIDHSPHPALIAQLREAAPVSRECTGAGLYLALAVPASAQQPLPSDILSPINGPQISAPSLTNGAGCLLFHEHGVVTFLEVYTYTDSMFRAPAGYSLQSA